MADKPRDKIIEWLNSACIEENIPYINGGLNLHRASFYSVIPKITGCAECWSSSVNNVVAKQVLQQDFDKSIDYDVPAPALSALVSVAAGIMVSEAIKIITNISLPSLTNKLKFFDFETCDIRISEHWELNPTCKVCGRKHEN